ncbi:MAG: transglutaminase domain-containing protein [Defluviitaleaceae bacterium]|nr:transglutaminase domain-containing protein [Defluviitaleaceae bacterium]
MKNYKVVAALVLTAVFTFGLTAWFTGGSEDDFVVIVPEAVPLNSSSHSFPMPVASGTNVRRVDRAEIDFSNASNGYVMVRFLENTTASVRVLITGPDEIRYQYRLNTDGRWEVFPLTAGNGNYTIGVFEQVDGNRFATVVSVNLSVTLSCEFAPFLRPNQFVNFNRESNAVTQAAQLVSGSQSVVESVGRVYNFVITNIEYDFDLAANVRSGYVPDIDRVLERRKGICFDYAALMTAMLRSQGIPTKLVIGYAGDVFHAWISVHSEETGWINNIIWFDGEDWRLMDPTFAATANQSESVMRFIGDGTNYNPTHFH